VKALVRADGEVLRAAYQGGGGKHGPARPSLASRLRDTLVGIQYGTLPHPWSVPIE
jgi:hypothetical protein